MGRIIIRFQNNFQANTHLELFEPTDQLAS